MSTHANMVKMTVSSVSATPSTGKGDITLNAASTGFQSFADAYGANATVDILITKGAEWEVARNCTYTHSGTTLTRGTWEDSSNGTGAIVADDTAVVSVVATAGFGNNVESVLPTYISGLLVTKTSAANTIDISAGKCYDPSSDKVISYAGATGVSAGTLGASQWNQVYIYDNSGTATIQVTNNENPPSATYAGTARKGGTNSNRRWIGCFLTNGSSNIVSMVTTELANGVLSLHPTGVRCLNGGSATSFTLVSFATAAPTYVTKQTLLNVQVAVDATARDTLLSFDGTNVCAAVQVPGATGNTGYFGSIFTSPVYLDSGVPKIYYKVSLGSTVAYIDVGGYEVAR